MTQELPLEFDGKGEVKGIRFVCDMQSGQAYIYERSDGNFEVFERRSTPICIDFEKRIYSETDRKEIYPKAKDFGKWAWTYKTLEQAQAKYFDIMTKTKQQ